MKNKLLSFALANLFLTSAFAMSVQFAPADGKTEFTAVGKPAMIKIDGHGEGPQGTLTYDKDTVNGTLILDLQKLTTDIDMRDEHMKNKYLEVQKYPKAELILKDFKLPVTIDQLKDTEVPFQADLTLHGKTQPVKGKAVLKKVDQRVQGEAEFSVKIMNYLETLPSYAGIKVAEDVKVKIKLNGQIVK